ncbi:adenosylcobinamide-phosphate synthase CbiB [Halomarina ordinaria]|uniref:Probable cobalamin biosynthesis protein CobD n=1 Tax=Halomarina ordinaria TaxID=3033939 RepID=A0ABD5U8Z1_9EURY|nr:adenosylcobinamide-phosphate synthase CbiB [Halomarina sp. PSRA2]
MSLAGAGAVALAAVLDAVAAEPPARVHPVAWFGRLVAPLDREWTRPRLVGGLVALCLPALAGGVVGGLVALAASRSPALAALLAGLVLFSTTSRRMLTDLARSVVDASSADLPRARRDLRGLAGRDAGALSPGEVRSAAVESAAENLADGLVAPLLGFVAGTLLGGLPLGAGLAAWVKGVNTLDSMLGYRSKPVGTASARLDDAVMWLPARASAALLALAAGAPRALAAARPWLAGVPSPNSGWPMGTLAAATGARLEKPGVYTLNPDAPLPSLPVAERGVCVVDRAAWLAVALAALALALPALPEVGGWS